MKPGSSKTVAAAFALLLAAFVGTHVLEYPGSLAYFKKATGGQKILDLQASSSADETHRRLEAMGDGGRDLYVRTILTIDLVFPASMLAFLLAWARFAAGRLELDRRRTLALAAVPMLYFSLDLFENASSLVLLADFPERIEFIEGAIGYVTRGKRGAMIAAFFLPGSLLLLRRLLRPRGAA